MNGKDPILRIDSAVASGPTARRALPPISLTLAPGDTALLIVPDPEGIPAIGDLICGLEAPERGTVEFKGRAWTDCGPDGQAAMRSRIGRVFFDAAWLSNLDVDENVMLAARYHAIRPAQEAATEAEALARAFGLDGLPRGRPAWVDPADLQATQWVRAWLGRPELLLLEEPLRHADARMAAALISAARDAAAAGAAVVWMTERDAPDLAGALAPRIRQVLSGAQTGAS